ncbi:TAXI family TRAP transporter solute-binding subunit [Streptomyces oryzae]|uniref:TAXI family TRAP transporter solute-binding subunit n=1 Tax=Streptomyces oryzae TaxID=1434886 RepID=A0ABS3X7H7_9ACTN|nr:TAXI family TRAP transporter solute-binding subunit [Streptomyces oryzae]MBO8191326.1 TAXI family TRAP transporter solute-binding subunit [Streptomyces oryzae]
MLSAGLGGVAGAALSGCVRDAGPVRRLRLATGPEGGPYNAFGRALAKAVAESTPRLRITPVPTSASVDNLRKLDDGSVELALAMADAAQDAVLGEEPFARAVPVTALARIYVNYTHLVVPAEGPVRSLDDLARRPVAAGAAGSGVQVVAGRLLRAAGLTGERSVRERRLGLAASAAALREGTVDALIWSGGVPTPTLAALAREVPLRFLPLEDTVAALRERYGPGYTAVALPAGAYGLTEPVGTIGVGNYLMARAAVPRWVVSDVLQVVFDQWRVLLRKVTAGARLEPRFAISTGAVPLHPGAVAYYRSVYD